MNALAESLEAALPEIQRDPFSRQASDAMTRLVEETDAFLASPILGSVSRLKPAERAAISRQAQHVAEIMRDMLSVADQLEDLGRGRAPWRTALGNALRRFETTLRRRGIMVNRSTSKPMPIVGKLSAAPTAPFLVATTVARRRELEPYIDLAMRDAAPKELEPGHWYADLSAFSGVWADGASAQECLETLRDVLHEWVLVKIAHGDRDIPVIDELDPVTLLRI